MMMQNPQKVVQNSWLAMVALQTIGSIDATHKLPAPKRFVAISILWGILSLIAEMGQARLAARFSLFLLLVGTVIGPFGKRLGDFMDTIAKTFAVESPADDLKTIPGSPSIPSARPRR